LNAKDDEGRRVSVENAIEGPGLVRPLFDVPGVGRIAILKDPTGAGLGWITPAAAPQ
jgi:predicted enzyme related to lactoylglutathione lyase